jgi:hypothetical protein
VLVEPMPLEPMPLEPESPELVQEVQPVAVEPEQAS